MPPGFQGCSWRPSLPGTGDAGQGLQGKEALVTENPREEFSLGFLATPPPRKLVLSLPGFQDPSPKLNSKIESPPSVVRSSVCAECSRDAVAVVSLHHSPTCYKWCQCKTQRLFRDRTVAIRRGPTIITPLGKRQERVYVCLRLLSYYRLLISSSPVPVY